MRSRSPFDWHNEFRRWNACVKRHGLAAGLRIGARQASRLAYCYEAQVWYELALDEPRPRLDLPPALGLVKLASLEAAEPYHRRLVDQLHAVSGDEAAVRLSQGRHLWLVHDHGRVVFACWTFRRRMPVTARRDIDIELPERAVGVDDAIGAPAVLGRGIASAAWSQIADTVGESGTTTVISKVGETDLAGRRAIEQAGFRAVASVELQHVGHHYWIDVRPFEPGGLGLHLAEQLTAAGEISA